MPTIGDLLQDQFGTPAIRPTMQPSPGNVFAGVQQMMKSPMGDPKTPENFAAAVAETKKRYPRFSSLPLALTYNPKRDRNSETYPTNEDGNPVPGHITVDMGREPYSHHPESWPELIALEAIHGLQEKDPTYQKFTHRLVQSYTPEQMANAHKAFKRDRANGSVPDDFNRYLHWVDAQEVVRGRLWGQFFKQYEHPTGDAGIDNPWEGYTPQQVKLLDNLQNYLRSSD